MSRNLENCEILELIFKSFMTHFVSDPSRVLNISPLLSFSITHPVFKCFCGGLVFFFIQVNKQFFHLFK